jgi:hypothetical protein
LAAKESLPIKITLPDDKVVDGQSWKTTPYDVATGIRYLVIILHSAYIEVYRGQVG